MSSSPRLTTTSYAVLSLLAVRPMSTYELAQQMRHSFGRFWPRAQSKLYEEPKKLVEHGLATARKERVGDRPRTVYRITAGGRRALADWMAEPAAGPSLEFEGLLKVSFAEHGTRDDALAHLADVRAWAVERNEENLATGRAYLAGEGEFQARVAQNMLGGSFLTEYYRMVAEWADWATALVERWPEDPTGAVVDEGAFTRVVERASWSETDSSQ